MKIINQNDMTIIQDGSDSFDQTLAAPVSKLDADQYYVDDLDGITESVFGSGTVAYASLQAAQTDMLLNNQSLDILSQDGFSQGGTPLSNLSGGVSFGDPFQPSSNNAFQVGSTDTDRNLAQNDAVTEVKLNGNGQFSSSTVGSASASELASNNSNFSSLSAPPSSTTTLLGNDGQNGSDGNNGSNGNEGDGDTLINIEVDLDLDISLTETTDQVFDISNQLITQVTETVGDIVTIVNQVTDNLTGVLNLCHLGDALDLTQALTLVSNINDYLLGGVSENLTVLNQLSDNILDGLADTVLDVAVDLDLLTLLQSTLDLSSNGLLDNDLNLTVSLDDLSAVANLEATLADLGSAIQDVKSIVHQTVDALDGQTGDLSAGVTDTLGDIGTALDVVVDDIGLGLENTSEDTDLSTNLDIPLVEDVPIVGGADIVIDVVEDLIGDVDTDLDLGLDLLGAEGTETDNAAGDTDIVVNTDIDLVDDAVADIVADIELDPIEDIVGDVDLNLDLATDLLGAAADPLIDDADGGTGEDTLLSGIGDSLSEIVDLIDINIDSEIDVLQNDVTDIVEDLDSTWTEPPLEDGVGLFADIIDGATPDVDILPDPIGTVAEGIGVLDIEPENILGGGLFG